jgi:hypothetical protein
MPPPPLKSGEAPLGVASTAGSDVFNTLLIPLISLITIILLALVLTPVEIEEIHG